MAATLAKGGNAFTTGGAARFILTLAGPVLRQGVRIGPFPIAKIQLGQVCIQRGCQTVRLGKGVRGLAAAQQGRGRQPGDWLALVQALQGGCQVFGCRWRGGWVAVPANQHATERGVAVTQQGEGKGIHAALETPASAKVAMSL